MAVLQALGIDVTVVFQFTIAAMTFIALSILAFKPYLDALIEREKRTKGGESEAVEFAKQAVEMRAVYEAKAREVSSKIKTIYDSYRTEGSKEYNDILAKARADSQKIIDETRTRVSLELTEASKKLKEEIPQIASAISQKLLSKKA